MIKYLKTAMLFVLSVTIGLALPSYSAAQHNYKSMYSTNTKMSHNMGHKEKGHKNISRRLLKKQDVSIFLDTFNSIEKELNKTKASLFNNIETFENELKASDKISKILEKKGINSLSYIDIFTGLTSAYNEIKMRNFEEQIKNNQNKKIIPRKGLMLDHSSKEHSMLHAMQASNFSEKFDKNGLEGEGDEPPENIKLVKRYEKKLDALFHAPRL